MELWQEFLAKCIEKLRSSVPKDIERDELTLMSYLLFSEGTNSPNFPVNLSYIRKYVKLWIEKQVSQAPFTKSLEKCKELRKFGNKEFQDKNYVQSIQYYTRSLQYAPWNSEDSALAVGNRSASLFYLRKFKECIKDIELAIKCNYPKNIQYKLYLRKAQSYLHLRDKESMENALQLMQECLDKTAIITPSKKDDLKKKVSALATNALNMKHNVDSGMNIDHLPDLPSPVFGYNPTFKDASAALEVQNAPGKGRYVITNKEIKKGDVLFCEKPFAFVLLEHDGLAVCAHCCRNLNDGPLPCTKCADILYCDIKCRNDAWSTYHRWECFGNQLGIWKQIGIAHLALKTFLTCCFTTNRDDLNKIQNLVTNVEKISSADFLVYGITALTMTLYLYHFTEFFKTVNIAEVLYSKFDDNTRDELQPNDENKIILFTGKLLLRYMLQLICNGHAITRLNLSHSENENVEVEEQCRIATAIYPSASMMNHSCDPNIINSFYEQWLIIKATKNIPVGTEIFNCYGPHYRRMKRKSRQEVLSQQYCFTCKCEACTKPAYQCFTDRFIGLKCIKCTGPLYNIRSSAMHCLDCGDTSDLSKNILEELTKSEQLFNLVNISVEHNDLNNALHQAKLCLQIRRNMLYKHHDDIAVTLNLMGKIYAIMGRWLDSILYLEQSLGVVDEKFGPDSIELANELNKITDICIRYLHEETNTNTKRYKNTLKKSRRFLNRADEILCLNYGPWNNSYQEIQEKKKMLAPLLKSLNL